MLRTLVTYLLLLNLFNLSLLKLQEDSTIQTTFFSKTEVVKSNAKYGFHATTQLKESKKHAASNRTCATIESMPLENENENEVETETLFDNLIHLIKSTETHSTDLQSLFFYNNTYEHLIIKIHFLDIFSPPPNC
jgi:hypothetical protein